MNNERDVSRYTLLERGKVVLFGITYDFARREAEHRINFPNATIKQVGKRVTWEEGQKWEIRMMSNI